MAKALSNEWLIRSGGKILGPFTQQEIGGKLKGRELVVIDEVSAPGRRWLLLRDHPDFQDIIDQLRKDAGLNFEDTAATGYITDSLTQSVRTDVDEITQSVSDFPASLKEIVYDNVNETVSQVPPFGSDGRYQLAGSLDEARIRAEAERGSMWLWLLTILILGLVAGFIWLRSSRNTDSTRLPKDPYERAMVLYEIGEFNAALTDFKRIAEQPGTKNNFIVPYALLLMLVDGGQTVEARRQLGLALAEGKDEVDAIIALGISEMIDGDWAAAETRFRRAMSLNSSAAAAQINLGTVALQTRDFEKASYFLDRLTARGFRDGVILLNQLEIGIEKFRREKVEANLVEALRLAEAYSNLQTEFAQELRLGMAYGALIRGQESGLADQVRQILDMDPTGTEDFRPDLLVYRGRVQQVVFGDWCKALAEALQASASGGAVKALCLVKQRKFLEAKSAMESAVNQEPKEALLQAYFAHVLKSAGFASEASVALGRAIDLDRRRQFFLPTILQARFCAERGDWDCARKEFQRAYELNSRSPAAKAGFAQQALSQQSNADARRYLLELRPLAPNYKPFLKMQRQLADLGVNL